MSAPRHRGIPMPAAKCTSVLTLLVALALVIAPCAVSACQGHGSGCWFLAQCCDGLSCHPFIQKCYNSPRREGEPCMLGYECGQGLNCEAGTQVCKRPAQAGEACHATRPCADGLSCQPGVHKCYHVPRQYEEPCSAGFECGDGLSCHPGVQKCFHSPRRMAEPCVAGFECAADLKCQPFIHICTPGEFDINNKYTCKRMYEQRLANFAKSERKAHAYGGIVAAAAGITASREWGVVYGPDGEYGCYMTNCDGVVTAVSVTVGFDFSFYNTWGSVAGNSYLVQGGVGVPFPAPVTGGWTGAAIMSTDHQAIGMSNTLSIGFGFSPVVSGGVVQCTTYLGEVPAEDTGGDDADDDADRHVFEVNAIYTTDWAQWRMSSNGRPSRCDQYAYKPDHLKPELYTHIFYAFAKVTPEFEVVNVEANEDELIALLPKGPSKLISIGGWSFSRSSEVFEGKGTHLIFPALARTSEGRAKFIASAISYAQSKGFQGIDLDWEYPNYENAAETQRERGDFTLLLKELYPACKAAGLLLTAAVRAINAGQHYELGEIHKHLDWINIMSYDFYGGSFPGTHVAQLHTPIRDCHSTWCGKPFDISMGLRQFLDAGVPANKLVFGLGTYGRTFKLSNPQGPTAPGLALATGPAPQGECTLAPGVLAWYEIKEEMAKAGTEPVVDTSGMAAYATYGPNREYWVGFDTPDTLYNKVCYAAAHKLRGTMAWDGELDDHQELLTAVKGNAWGAPRSCSSRQTMPADCGAPPEGLTCTAVGGGDGGGGGGGGGTSIEGCSETVMVAAGGTCWALWTAHGLSEQQFMALNPGVNCGALAVGQALCVAGSGSTGSGGSSGGVSTGCTSTVTVKSGDTCWALWSANGLTEQQFMALNPGVNCGALAVGQALCVAGGSGSTGGGSTGCTNTVTVKSGDTCWSLWSANGLTEQQFMAANPGVNCGALWVGQVLCVGA